MSQSTVIARIGKPHGLHGEVTVQLHTDEPERRLAVGTVIDTEAGRRHRGAAGADRAVDPGAQRRLAASAFEEIPDRTGAESLRGTRLVVDSADVLPAPDEDDVFTEEQLRGLAVVDPAGSVLGTVGGLELGAAQDRLVILLPDGREAQVPFVAAHRARGRPRGRPRRRRRPARAARPRGVTPVRVDVVSIFPEYLAPLDLSLIGKARRDGILDVRVHDLRDFTHDRHRTVDDSPFGGGAGMVMKPEPWAEALDAVVAVGGRRRCRGAAPDRARARAGCRSARRWPARSPRSRGWRSPAGATRASTSASTSTPPTRMPVTVVSLGDYVLNGGEVAVLAMVEAVGRLLPASSATPSRSSRSRTRTACSSTPSTPGRPPGTTPARA